MKPAPLVIALKHAGAWSILLAFVALLTVIFSFLGTLFCAALGGMMMGATRASKTIALIFSLLCCGVLLGVLRTERTELAAKQVAVLAVLCLGAFWFLYVVALSLVAFEKNGNSDAGQAPKPAASLASRPGEKGGGSAAVAPTAAVRLEDLDGRWCSEKHAPGCQNPERVLEIHSGSLDLNTLDARGQVCARVQGRLKLLTLSETGRSNCPEGAELAAGI
jgi:hypothetical protein